MPDTQPALRETNPDLLSSWLVSQEVVTIVKKNYKITQIIFAISIAYTLVVFASTYLIFQFRSPTVGKTPYFFYFYRIFPLVELTMAYLYIWSYFTINKAYKQFLNGFANGNPAALRIGFTLFYKTNLVSLGVFILNTAHGIFILSRMNKWIE